MAAKSEVAYRQLCMRALHRRIRVTMVVVTNGSRTKARFDTSEYPADQPSGIKTGINKKVFGMFKDEAAEKQIKEFVGLKAKSYLYKMLEGNEHEKCKGIKKNVVKTKITHDDYKECLFSKATVYRPMNVIRSYKHDMYTEEVNQIALSADDDKRVIMDDGIHTPALGHYKLAVQLRQHNK